MNKNEPMNERNEYYGLSDINKIQVKSKKKEQ